MAVGHERTIGSKGNGLFGIPHAQLPAKIQHVYNDLVESGKPVGGHTYRLAVGIVQNWAAGHDGKGSKVSAKTQAEAAKAVAEWERLKARAHARSGRKDVSEASAEERDAARRLAALMRQPRASLRTLDRATVAAGLLAGERPRDHEHALQMMEALADCGCGGVVPGRADADTIPVVLAEAKDDKKKKKDDGGELEAEVARLKKKGMPHKLAYKAACKKLGVKEAADEDAPAAPRHSRLAETRFAPPHQGIGSGGHFFDSSKHPRAHGKFASKGGAPGNVHHSRLAQSPGRIARTDGAETIVPNTPAEKAALAVQMTRRSLRKAARSSGGLVELELKGGGSAHGTFVGTTATHVILEDANAEQFQVPLAKVHKASPAGG